MHVIHRQHPYMHAVFFFQSFILSGKNHLVHCDLLVFRARCPEQTNKQGNKNTIYLQKAAHSIDR